MFAAARLYQHKELVIEALNFIDYHALEVLQSEAFLSLSSVSLKKIIIILYDDWFIKLILGSTSRSTK